MANLTDFYVKIGSDIRGPYNKSSMGKYMAAGIVKSESRIAFVPSGTQPRPKDFRQARDFPLWHSRERYAHSPADSEALRRTKPSEKSHSNRVVVTDFDMPFGSMVSFMIKWAIASIPAAIILAVLFSLLWGILVAG